MFIKKEKKSYLFFFLFFLNTFVLLLLKYSKMFSSSSKYAIRAVLYLAMLTKKNGSKNKILKVGIKKLSEDLKIPTFFLGKIMQTLAKNKILKSHKGPNGGFSFNKDPNEISLYEIVKIFDGEEIFNTCILGLSLCNQKNFNKEDCPFAYELDLCVDRINKYLQNTYVGLAAESLNTLNDIFTV